LIIEGKYIGILLCQNLMDLIVC